jgi:hypothetical protein
MARAFTVAELMEALLALQQLGLELPSPTYIVGAVVFGIIGFLAFRDGRRTKRRLTLWLGVALMFYPYAVSGTWMLYMVGACLCAALAIDRRGQSR